MAEVPHDTPLLIGVLADVSGSMRSSIGSSGDAAINRLEAFSEALENLVNRAAASVRESSQRGQSLDVRLYAYGFGFGNVLSRLLGGSGPTVRDLLGGGGREARTVDVVSLAEHWSQHLANVRGMAYEMFGSTPMREAFERAKQTIESEIVRQPATSVLFVLSDGDPTDGNAETILPIVAQIQRMGTTIVSCFVTDFDITEPQRLYGEAQGAWPDAARLMFDCASELERASTFEAQFHEYGWQVDPRGRLFAQVNQSEMLSEFLNVVLSPLREEGDDLQEKGVAVSVRRVEEQRARVEKHVVILVHGIRDFARWQTNVRDSLENEGFKSESTNYGRFNLIEFLLPLSYFRKRAIAEVWKQIRIIKQNNPDALLSVIAHSFGTYVVAHLMQENFDIAFHRVIFCGSVVRYGFSFEQFQNRFRQPIINEVGTRDIWPAMAESVTMGYGSAGTYGFRRPLTRDRWHNGARHGYFLNDKFCKKFWVPLLRDDKFISGEPTPEAPPLWIRIISIVKIKYVLALILLFLSLGIARQIDVANYLHSVGVSGEKISAQDEAVNTILSGCYRRALFTQTQRELNIQAMFESIDKCREIVQSQIPHIQRKEPQGEAVELLAALTGIEALRNRPLATDPINKLKLVALESFRRLAGGTTGAGYPLPVSGKLSGTIFGTDLAAANAPLNSKDLNDQVSIDLATGAARY
jgi:hypothetical protein